MKSLKKIAIVLGLLFVISPVYSSINFNLPDFSKIPPQQSGQEDLVEHFYKGYAMGNEMLVMQEEHNQRQIQTRMMKEQYQQYQLQNQMMQEELRQRQIQRFAANQMINEQKINQLNKELLQKEKAALLGDAASAFKIGRIYDQKAVYSSPEESINYQIAAYAWFQVSKKLGKKTYIRDNGDLVTISWLLERFRTSDDFSALDVNKANELTLKICKNIPKCTMK